MKKIGTASTSTVLIKPSRTRKRTIKAIEADLCASNDEDPSSLEENESYQTEKFIITPKSGKHVEICQCKVCGVCGVLGEFHESGQFCSTACSSNFKMYVKKKGKTAIKKNENFSIVPAKGTSPTMLYIPRSSSSSATPQNKEKVRFVQPFLPSLQSSTNAEGNSSGLKKLLPSTIPTGTGMINLTIANGEVIQTSTPGSTTNSPVLSSFPSLFVPVPDNPGLLVPSPGLNNSGQQMMLLKTIPPASVPSSTFPANVSTKSDAMISTNTIISNSALPKTVFVPMLSPITTSISSSSLSQQTLSTPSGQQIQITLTPKNTHKILPAVTIEKNPQTLNGNQELEKTFSFSSKATSTSSLIANVSKSIDVASPTVTMLSTNTKTTSITSAVTAPSMIIEKQSQSSNDGKSISLGSKVNLNTVLGCSSSTGSMSIYKASPTWTTLSPSVRTISTTSVTKTASKTVPKKPISSDALKHTINPIQTLNWIDGVGTLVGSNLKFMVNEFGSLEMVSDDFTGIKGNKPALPDESAATDPKILPQEKTAENTIKKSTIKNTELKPVTGLKKQEAKESGQICCCSNCGCFGPKAEFCKSGRFCSMACVGANAHKQRILKDFSSVKQPNSEISNVQKFLKSHANKDDQNFNWQQYLKVFDSKAAPNHLFKKPYPEEKCGFRFGMKLEVIDPNHQSLFCVATISEVLGYRILIHFDGYPETYDFWVDADSIDIFPVGWCKETGRELLPPKGFQDFTWEKYLAESMAQAAPRHLFLHLKKSHIQLTNLGFKVGQHLEAVDKKNNLMCVTSIKDIMDDRFLVHFDGWDDFYEYWVDPSSPFIHPVGWSEQNDVGLIPPRNHDLEEAFSWDDYLAKCNSTPVPSELFKPRKPISFVAGHKVEVVDIRNPSLIRVATIREMKDFSVLIHFDGWSSIYDFWLDDDSPCIHPVNWCSKTFHNLQPPPGEAELSTEICKVPGCIGIGNVKKPRFNRHHSNYGCPYSRKNMKRERYLLDRLEKAQKKNTVSAKTAAYLDKTSQMNECIKENQNSNLNCSTQNNCDATNNFGSIISNQENKKISEITIKTTKRGRKRKKFDDYITGDFHTEALERVISSDLSCGKEEQISAEPSHAPDTLAENNHAFDEFVEKSHALDEFVGKSHAPDTIVNKSHTSSQAVDESKSVNDSDLTVQIMNNIHMSVFCPKIPIDPDRDFKKRWVKNIQFLSDLEYKRPDGDVAKWSVEDVGKFIGSLPVDANIVEIFKNEQIDGESLLLMNQVDFVKILQLKLGPSLIILNSVRMLVENCDSK